MRIAICDDEKIICELLYKLVSQVTITNNIKSEIDVFNNGQSLLSNCESGESYSIVLLDMHMNEINGYQVANQLRKLDESVIIIVITSFLEHVREMFKVNVFRYVLKDRLAEELEEAIISAYNQIINNDRDYFIVKSSKEIYKLKLKDILYFESFGHTITVYTTNEQLSFRGTLSEIVLQLSSKGFVMPFKGFLLNSSLIYKIAGNHVIMCNTKSIPLSNKYKEKVIESIKDSVGN